MCNWENWTNEESAAVDSLRRVMRSKFEISDHLPWWRRVLKSMRLLNGVLRCKSTDFNWGRYKAQRNEIMAGSDWDQSSARDWRSGKEMEGLEVGWER